MKNKLFIILSIAFVAIITFWTCKDDEEELPKATGNNKVVLTLTKDSTSYVFSTFTCELSLKPKFKIKQHGFCWDTLANVTTAKEHSTIGELTSQTFTNDITSLLPDKTYYVKAYLQSGDVIIYSNELPIHTLNAKPVVTTADISNIKANRSESGGTVSSYAALFPITQRGVCWGKTLNPTILDSLTNNGTGNGTFTSNIAQLDVSTNYYVRAYAINSEGITYGNQKSFTTLDGVPVLTTDSVRNISTTTASVYASFTDNDGLDILEKGFCWNTVTNPTILNSHATVSGNTLGNYSLGITGLSINTTYYIKAYIKNNAGTYYGNEIIFATNDGLSAVTTNSISDITAISASCSGTIVSDGGFTVTARGTCWSTAENPTIAGNHTTNGSGLGTYISSLTALNPNTTYYVRAYATNINGTVYGNQMNFDTKSGISTLTTTTVTSVTAISATSGGNITDDGGSAITARGICWSTNTNPTITDDTTKNGSGTGVFTSNLMGLSVNTNYYVRAYATNGIGTTYGTQQSFTTKTGVPTITTTAITGMTETTATGGGNISDDGGLPVTARGVCWSTSQNPTTTDDYTTNGTGTGSFTSNLTGLTAGTDYYVRAYATNALGTTYGNEVSFSTTNPTVIDFDGNVYNIVEIGTQTWLKENLKVTHYRNGDAISNVTDGTTWSNLSTGALCSYQNNSAYSATYGYLYNYYTTIDNRNLCPTGWHVPTHNEWKVLEMFLGLSQAEADADGWRGTDQGSQLKSTTNWFNNGNGTNSSSFTALPGGNRGNDGSFGNADTDGFWWTTNENSALGAWYRNLNYNYPSIFSYSNFKVSGYSIRCIKGEGQVLPAVITTAVTNLTSSSATTGGNVTSDGNSAVTQRGICYSKLQNPTNEDSIITNGTGTGSFTINITGLTANTTYYARAFATNSVGTVYGSQVNITTTSTVTDYDGNIYNTVTIGTQVWMKENLKVAHYRNGDPIPNVTDGAIWFTLSTGALCSYENNTSNSSIYGYLYNYYTTIDNRNVCPIDWRVPTDNDWTILNNNLGGYSVAGGKLKEIGIEHWQTPNTNATNESGFTGLPGGYRYFGNGGYSNINVTGFWWSSSELSNTNSWYRYLSYSTGEFVRADNEKGDGFSIRCIQGEGIVLPNVTTAIASIIASSSANSGGNITTDGGAPVTTRGVCWSTTEKPVISGDHTTDGTGTGSFTSNITGLTPNTTYYVRAYATNSVGTEYGNQITFTTPPTATDYNGNVYQSVIIGDQIWMSENLKSTHYSSGTAMVNGAGAGDITGNYTTKYYFSYENNDANIPLYGRLYTWAAVMNGAEGSTLNPSGVQGACPTGWHVPSDTEWIELADYLGGSTVAGLKLKSESGWYLSGNGNNLSGFNAPPSGHRNNSGGYSSPQTTAPYWTSAGSGSSAVRRYLDYSISSLTSGTYTKDEGYAVRCVKD